MPEYMSPGVYVEEVPSAIKPIAGVSTRTACFLGIVPDSIDIPEENENYDPTGKSKDPESALPYTPKKFTFPKDDELEEIKTAAQQAREDFDAYLDKSNVDDIKNLIQDQKSADQKTVAKKAADKVGDLDPGRLKDLVKGLGADKAKALFKDKSKDFVNDKNELEASKLRNLDGAKTKGLFDGLDVKELLKALEPGQIRRLLSDVLQKAEDAKIQAKIPAKNGEPVLCTNFSEFRKHFGGFSTDGLGVSSSDVGAIPDGKGLQNRLAHAVFGFFDNGGTRCYVMRFRTGREILEADHLDVLEANEEISIIAAPGITDTSVQKNIVEHCENLQSRFAILDPPELDQASDLTEDTIKVVGNSDYAALYFPRIQVFDVAAQLTKPEIIDPTKATEISNGKIWLSPSGHMAGVYSRVDQERGVHKAPANVVVRDARDLEFAISKNQQGGLNPHGINCIRSLNGKNITVWGARTIGGDANTDLKYINVRRTLIFLRESIDRGTQGVVFEPNDQTLWKKIVLNVTAFLTTVWRDGALFGSAPQEAFYVKCDAELNTREQRDLGRVITEIGVAIVRPAEFVIFRISQWAGPEQK